MLRRRIVPCLALTAAALLSAALPAQKGGFGWVKRQVNLERRLLPDAELKNVSLAVVVARGGGNGLNVDVFTSEIETLVAQSSSGIRLVAQNPQYQIRCFPTSYQRPHIVSKTENKVTTRSATGEATMDARIVRSSDGFVVLAFSEVATLNASSTPGNLFNSPIHLPVINIPGIPHRNAPPAAAAVAAGPTEQLGENDTDATLEARLLRSLALRVASHMTPMNETIPVLLAGGGSLDAADKYAMNGRWTEYLEAVSAVPPASTPADDAYRLYDTGVANEALGYAASTPQIALKYLDQASTQYGRAAESRPDEKYFGPPQKRIEVALARYNGLLQRQKPGGGGGGGGGGTANQAASRSDRFGNGDVIKLIKANVPKEVIASKIETAPDPDFDLSTDGLIALSGAGVPADLMSAMNRRMNPGQAQPAVPARRR